MDYFRAVFGVRTWPLEVPAPTPSHANDLNDRALLLAQRAARRSRALNP